MLFNWKAYNESREPVDILDAGWLYFLHTLYPTGMTKKSWGKDIRMNGRNFEVSMSKFDCVDFDGETYIVSDWDKAKSILDHYFGMSFEEAVRNIDYDYETKVPNAHRHNDKYNISKIPYDYYLRHNEEVDNDFDELQDLFVAHWNSQTVSDTIIKKFLKVKNLYKWNYKNFIEEFPDEPKEIKIYRGIKSDYDEKFKKKYSAWTTNLITAQRFANYHFTGGQQFEPIYSVKRTILETTVKFEDILIYIGGSESEVILRNPVKNAKILK